MSITIKIVKTRSERKQVNRFIASLYKNSPCWVPPLWNEELRTFELKHNPALEFSDTETWTAWKDDRLAGTITGIINHRFIEQWNRKHARFGWFECIEDKEVADALFEAVESWAVEKGMEAIVGPMGFSDFDKEGLLIEGYDEMSTFAMLYNLPYYKKLIENRNYVKDADWVEYRVQIPRQIPDKVVRVQNLVLQRQNVHLLETHRRKDIIPYIPDIFRLLGQCYSHLYGYVTLTEKQIDALVTQYISLIDHRLTKVMLDDNDNVIACGICMPSFSEAMRKAGGRLFPLGFLHLLHAMRKPKVLDLYLIAVLPEYQKRGILAVMMGVINQEAVKLGITEAETLAELEDNVSVQSLWKSYDTRQHKRRRVYRKDL